MKPGSLDNPCTNITPSLISIAGFPVDAEGKLLVRLQPGLIYDVTPTVAGMTDYSFNVTVAPQPKMVPLTWSYHQMFHRNTANPPFVPTLSDWQNKFDKGSELLGTDHDARIPLNDPSATDTNDAGGVYRSDDVPLYVEFILSEGLTNYCFYTRSMLPVFPPTYQSGPLTYNFGSSNYFRVKQWTDAFDLWDYTGANVKIVKSIVVDGGIYNGVTRRSEKPATIVMAAYATDVTCVHEWGHSCGLRHRGESDTNGIPYNPGPTNNAIMTFDNGTPRNEINRFERAAMNSY